MAPLLTRAEPASNGSNPRPREFGTDPTSPSSASPRTPRRRNSARIAIGVIVLVLSLLGAMVLFSSATDRVTVIGVARDVPAGHVVAGGDLREVSISGGDGLSTISASDARRVVGRTAAVTLSAGSLVTSDQLTDGPTFPDGTVIAGAVLKPGQYPVRLAIGDSVEVVETTAPDATGAGQPLSRGVATVVDVHQGSDGQSLLAISLAIPSKDAAAISSAGAAGRLSVVVTSP